MKQFTLILALFLTTNIFSQEFKLVQINAEWNQHNDIGFSQVEGIQIQYALLHQQSAELRREIKSVPTLILYRDGRIAYSWEAGIDLKCKVTPHDIITIIERLKQ